jgi:prepilin-type N-terminal cleavage/methylation domain-containing protein
MRAQKAFTLIEVLISIVLLGLIIPALYKSVDMLRNSNRALFSHLQQSKKEARAIETLFLDIASSDGNLTIRKDTFDRLCIEATQNSLYGLAFPKVCWVVLKEGHDLVRVEGYDFHLPLKSEEFINADIVVKQLDLFDVHWKKDRVVVMLQQKHQEPVSFMVQGITKPKKTPKKRPKKPTATKKTEIPPKELSPQKQDTKTTPPSIR